MRNFLGTASTVTSTELWLSELQAGRAFASGDRSGAVGGQFSHIQLFNPAASGKTAVIRAVFGIIEAQGILVYGFRNTQLVTDLVAGVNLLDGGAAAVCHLRSENNAAQQIDSTLFKPNLLAFTPFNPADGWCAQLAPGQGLVVVANTVNVAMGATFVWREA